MTDADPIQDPIDYLADALALLPADPAKATAEDLERLAAISEGLARLTRAINSALARRVNGATDVSLADLDVAHLRDDLAGQQFHHYAEAACAARGMNLAGFLAGDDHTTKGVNDQ